MKLGTDEEQVRDVLEEWALATRQGRQDDVLANHRADVVIFDVLPPLQYESLAAYRRSWDEWQPDTQGEGQFALRDLVIVTGGGNLAFAHGLIQCGGTLPDGEVFEDIVRATFCLQRTDDAWKVTHQHISKPFENE